MFCRIVAMRMFRYLYFLFKMDYFMGMYKIDFGVVLYMQFGIKAVF